MYLPIPIVCVAHSLGALSPALKLSTDKVTEKKATVKIDYDKSLKYGTFVELGARGRAGRHMLQRAATEHTDEYKRLMEDSMKNA